MPSKTRKAAIQFVFSTFFWDSEKASPALHFAEFVTVWLETNVPGYFLNRPFRVYQQCTKEDFGWT